MLKIFQNMTAIVPPVPPSPTGEGGRRAMANLSRGPHPSGLSRKDHKMHWPKMTVQGALGFFLLVFIFFWKCCF